MESIGTRLRNRRQSQKLSIEEVSKKTKIHSSVLEALEEDRFNILDYVYIKGFLKIYSSFLGLDPAEIIDEYNSLVGHKDSRVFLESGPKKTAVDRIRPGEGQRPFFIIGLLVIISLLFLFFGWAARHKKAISVTKTAVVSAPLRLETRKTQEAASAKKQTAFSQVELSPLRLGIRAKDNCWVQVKLDGKTIFQGIIHRGQSESWQAKDKIEASIGNASAIELEVNNKILSPLGRRKEPLKNILITHEGVSIGK